MWAEGQQRDGACDPDAVVGREAHPDGTQILPGHLESSFQRLSIGLPMVDQTRGLRRPWRSAEAMPADGLCVGMWTLRKYLGMQEGGRFGHYQKAGQP